MKRRVSAAASRTSFTDEARAVGRELENPVVSLRQVHASILADWM